MSDNWRQIRILTPMITKYQLPFPPEDQQPSPRESVIVEDPSTAAVIHELDPLLEVREEPSYQSGRIAFRIEGDRERIRAAFRALAEDTPMGSRTLVEAIKTMRTRMFRAKATGGSIKMDGPR
jgi:hypothetical protein